jgi:hypothetical protein
MAAGPAETRKKVLPNSQAPEFSRPQAAGFDYHYANARIAKNSMIPATTSSTIVGIPL